MTLSQFKFNDLPNHFIFKYLEQNTNITTPFYEEELVAESLPPRGKLRFRAGRQCAHNALRELSCDNIPILKCIDGPPIWPNHFIGSISHTENQSVAIVGKSNNRHLSIGIDIETRGKLNLEMYDYVLTKNEKEHSRFFSNLHFLENAKIIFSCKESVYKCVYSALKIQLTLQDIEIILVENKFKALIKKNRLPGNLSGQINLTDKYILNWVSLNNKLF